MEIIDDNFVVIRGKCSETKKQYLLKYAKEFGDYFKQQFKIVGSYAIDGESYEALSDGKSKNSFNVNQLEGFPSCPCCGNTMPISRKIVEGTWQGWCFMCGATGPIRETSAEALEAWSEGMTDEVPNCD